MIRRKTWRTNLRSALVGLLACVCVAQLALAQSNWPKQPVSARQAMVVTDHEEATRVGLEVLQKGGNAVDAAVAVQFALAVVYPEAGNLGGGGFLLYRDASGQAEALDFREVAPAAAKADMYTKNPDPMAGSSHTGHLSVGVPGTVDGMWRVHAKHGSLPWRDLIEPAWLLAGRGFLLSERQAKDLNALRDELIYLNSTPIDFYRKDPWKAGDRLRQYVLTLTLEHIMNNGREGFYEGEVADKIVAEMRQRGGLITLQDLAQYTAKWREPHVFSMGKYRYITMPPPSSGGILLHQLTYMTQNQPIKKWGPQSAEVVHLYAEAMRRAFADRASYVADPDCVIVPVAGLTNPAYLQARMGDFTHAKATPSTQIAAGLLPDAEAQSKKEPEETTHYNIVDAQGNAVAVTTTLNGAYGSRVVVGDAGFFLNNEMDDFATNTGQANSDSLVYPTDRNQVAPGKRPLSSMCPTIIETDGQLRLVLGAAGGPTIPTAVFQVIAGVLIHEQNLQLAVNAGRMHAQWLPDVIRLEEHGYTDAVQQKLKAKGHELTFKARMARLNAIQRLPDGVLQGAADPRVEGKAAGY